MRFLFKWLRPERPAGVALHPSRTLELDADAATAFARCTQAIERVLGGIVRQSDSKRGYLEASFGLVNSERMTVTIDALPDARSRVIIESRRGPSPQAAPSSSYVTALASVLERDAGGSATK